MKETKKIAILTGGGDAPGMNAAIRGVVRAALNRAWEVYGIRDAYLGMVEGGDGIFPLDWIDVSWNFKEGGTFLGSARYTAIKGEGRDARFLREKALLNLKRLGITGLVVIGGDGSLTGAHSFYRTLVNDDHMNSELDSMELAIVGIPGSIDNDLPLNSMCIGVDTTLNTIMEAVDRLRDTAESHKRVSIVEVMGRKRGYLAVISGLATGADRVFIREHPVTGKDMEGLLTVLREGFENGQRSGIIIRSEGAAFSTDYLKETVDVLLVPKREVRETVLGHLQRGGTPTLFERNLAVRMGVKAVDVLAHGIQEPVFLGLDSSSVKSIPLSRIIDTLDTREFQDELSPNTQRIMRLGRMLEDPPPERQDGRGIAVLTDGNNVSGMNMAIRAIGRLAINDGIEVKGIKGGFSGLGKGRESIINLEWSMLELKGVLRRAGTLLRVSSEDDPESGLDFMAVKKDLEALNIDGMIVIGNRRTYMLADRLAGEAGIPVVGIPADMNCNMPGTDLVVGMDSSLNDMLLWIDKFAEAAHARRRIFILHIKGDFCSCSVRNAALAGGVEAIINDDTGPDDEGRRLFREMAGERIADIKRIIDLGKGFAVILYFSNNPEGAGESLAFIRRAIAEAGITIKTSVVPIETTYGGTTPTVFDRTLAMRFGEKALSTLRKKIDSGDYTLHMIGLRGKEIKSLPYEGNGDGKSRACSGVMGEELQRCLHLMSMPAKGCTGMGGDITWTNMECIDDWQGRWTCKMCGHFQDFSMDPGRPMNIRCENPECANYGYVRISRRL